MSVRVIPIVSVFVTVVVCVCDLLRATATASANFRLVSTPPRIFPAGGVHLKLDSTVVVVVIVVPDVKLAENATVEVTDAVKATDSA